MTETQPNGLPTEGIIRKNLLSETAAAHIKALEDLQLENRNLHQQLADLTSQQQRTLARLDHTEETLVLTRRALEYYRNFSVTLATKINDAQSIMVSAIDYARQVSDVSHKLAPLSPQDEERLKDLASRLAPDNTGGK